MYEALGREKTSHSNLLSTDLLSYGTFLFLMKILPFVKFKEIDGDYVRQIELIEEFREYPPELYKLQVDKWYKLKPVAERLAEIHNWPWSEYTFENWINCDYTDTFQIVSDKIRRLK